MKAFQVQLAERPWNETILIHIHHPTSMLLAGLLLHLSVHILRSIDLLERIKHGVSNIERASPPNRPWPAIHGGSCGEADTPVPIIMEINHRAPKTRRGVRTRSAFFTGRISTRPQYDLRKCETRLAVKLPNSTTTRKPSIMPSVNLGVAM